MGTRLVRALAVFNDEFAGENVTLVWQASSGDQDGAVLAKGEISLRIPLGEFAKPEVAFDAPNRPGEVKRVLSARKGGAERFTDDHTRVQLVPPTVPMPRR